MKFNEKAFRQLADETVTAVIRLGTTSHAVLDRYPRFTDLLVEHLKSIDASFNLEECLDWVNTLEHDPPKFLNTSYIEWKALHRFIHLLSEQQAGTLDHWQHYLTQKLKTPASNEFCEVLRAYEKSMDDEGFKAETIRSYASIARKLLLFLEGEGFTRIADISNASLRDYLKSSRFDNRLTSGIANEVSRMRKFILFLENSGLTPLRNLHNALPRIKKQGERIITTIDETIEADLMEDEPESLVNKRDQAILLLALHTGLRGCDIRALKFQDINWESETIHLRQQKTGADLVVPIDSATQNAIIDYVLHERRECSLEYIFITAVGPVKKLARRHYRIKYRTKGTDSFEQLPHDGLHIYRRTFASRLLESGASLYVISEMLGHINKNSVRPYLSTDETKMKRCALSLVGILCTRKEYTDVQK